MTEGVNKFVSWYLYHGYGRAFADQVKSDYGTVRAIEQDVESYIWEHDDFYQGCRAWMVATNRLYGISLKHHVFSTDAIDFGSYNIIDLVGREEGGSSAPMDGASSARPPQADHAFITRSSSDGECEDCPLVTVAQAFSNEWRLSGQGARLKSEREVFLNWVAKRTPVQHEVLHMYADGFADAEIAEMMQLEWKEVRSITTNLVNWAGRRGFVQDGLTTTG